MNVGAGVVGYAVSQFRTSPSEWMTSKALTLVLYTCFTNQRERTHAFGRWCPQESREHLSAFSCLGFSAFSFLQVSVLGMSSEKSVRPAFRGEGIGLGSLRSMWHQLCPVPYFLAFKLGAVYNTSLFDSCSCASPVNFLATGKTQDILRGTE